ncbi:MAG: aspartyl-tRNA(Asn)/glutamyl-tRNA(Gln) amidotransferase subunit B [Mariniblastus sp.]|jgi:aspartyl-tRNA(Asn)/glutamyl-tRNA(Gln) amidotransferase subunit B
MTSENTPSRASIKFSDVTVVIGLEVHVQLDTKSKLFCGCSTQFGAPPNTQTCPICTGMPGSLPVINERALKLAIKTGVALNCEIARYTKWDRKNYFYPDLPKGYQISQFDQPICGEGYLNISDAKDAFEPRRVRLERAHLEEDAGKSIHDETNQNGNSKIDLNRTGTPLLEIVTKPDMRSAAEAKAFLTELKLILNYIEVSDCNMQQGSLRCDGNINLHIEHDGQTIATPIVEIKNLNSFRAAERSLTYEAQRQFELWQANGKTIDDAPKQTRGWNDSDQVTTVSREKEESADYRYFPDPDLIAVTHSEQEIAELASQLARLPKDWREKLKTEHQLKPYDAEVLVSQGRGVVEYFLEVAEGCGDSRIANNWVGQEVLRQLNESNLEIEQYAVSAEQMTELLTRVVGGELDQTRAKEVLNEMVESKSTVTAAIENLGIKPVDNSELDSLCQQLLDENPDVASQIRDGNLKAVGMLIGKARKLNPNANPGVVKDKLLALISP